jgi:hypothetical protein
MGHEPSFPSEHAFCVVPAAHWHEGGKQKVTPMRIYLEPTGPVQGIFFFDLWFQRYFRKKRSLLKNILKKYEAVTHYLSVSILILSVEGKRMILLPSWTFPIMNPLLTHLCPHNV